jgi:hypothetical protein
MKRAAFSYAAATETEQNAPASEKARVRKVPQLSKGQMALHKGTGKGAFRLEKALNLYTPKAAK